jgi:hypothetical protein
MGTRDTEGGKRAQKAGEERRIISRQAADFVKERREDT